MKKSSLTIVGTGIKFIAQMTLEARSYIEKSDKLLYLVNEPMMQEWLKRANNNSESLEDIYFKYLLRSESYTAITNYILTDLTEIKNLCVVMYGHPIVFSKPALDAARIASAKGYDVRVLPGISAEACLFADLLIDPGSSGCQSFDATDFILYGRKFDTNCHLILWQPDVIGSRSHEYCQVVSNLSVLCEYLLQFYPHDHEVIIYEAAQYPGIKANINSILLTNLSNSILSSVSTLYIKPLSVSKYDNEFVKKLMLI